jgi:predicted amidohydrolase
VAVGYAEKDVSTAGPRAYNSLVFVNRAGEIIAHTRKRFLYYTDETWASEGQKFFAGELPLGSSLKAKKVAAGICMDINPYKFEAPWTSYEFANHALAFKAELVLLSTAWITQFSTAELQEHASLPDLDTVGYWLERMRPLMDSDGPEQEVIIVFANRCGEERGAPLTDPVRYAGSSTVMGISRGGGQVGGAVRIWDMLGRSEEGMLVVDTQDRAKYGLKKSMPAGSLGGEDAPRPSNDE